MGDVVAVASAGARRAVEERVAAAHQRLARREREFVFTLGAVIKEGATGHRLPRICTGGPRWPLWAGAGHDGQGLLLLTGNGGHELPDHVGHPHHQHEEDGQAPSRAGPSALVAGQPGDVLCCSVLRGLGDLRLRRTAH